MYFAPHDIQTHNNAIEHYKFTRDGKIVGRNPRRPLTVEKATQTN